MIKRWRVRVGGCAWRVLVGFGVKIKTVFGRRGSLVVLGCNGTEREETRRECGVWGHFVCLESSPSSSHP